MSAVVAAAEVSSQCPHMVDIPISANKSEEQKHK